MTELQKYLIEHPGAELKVSTDGFERLWYEVLYDKHKFVACFDKFQVEKFGYNIQAAFVRTLPK